MLRNKQLRSKRPLRSMLPPAFKMLTNILSTARDANLSDRIHDEAQMGRAGKEGGHKQMLGQAAAVLVSLSTLVTLEVSAAGLLAILG
jgi:hypothetical protein